MSVQVLTAKELPPGTIVGFPGASLAGYEVLGDLTSINAENDAVWICSVRRGDKTWTLLTSKFATSEELFDVNKDALKLSGWVISVPPTFEEMIAKVLPVLKEWDE